MNYFELRVMCFSYLYQFVQSMLSERDPIRMHVFIVTSWHGHTCEGNTHNVILHKWSMRRTYDILIDIILNNLLNKQSWVTALLALTFNSKDALSCKRRIIDVANRLFPMWTWLLRLKCSLNIKGVILLLECFNEGSNDNGTIRHSWL